MDPEFIEKLELACLKIQYHLLGTRPENPIISSDNHIHILLPELAHISINLASGAVTRHEVLHPKAEGHIYAAIKAHIPHLVEEEWGRDLLIPLIHDHQYTIARLSLLTTIPEHEDQLWRMLSSPSAVWEFLMERLTPVGTEITMLIHKGQHEIYFGRALGGAHTMKLSSFTHNDPQLGWVRIFHCQEMDPLMLDAVLWLMWACAGGIDPKVHHTHISLNADALRVMGGTLPVERVLMSRENLLQIMQRCPHLPVLC